MGAFARTSGYLRKYTFFVIMNVVCHIVNAVLSLFSILMLLPVLQILFGIQPKIETLPAFELDKDVIVDTLYYHLGQIIEQQGSEMALYYICGFTIIVFFVKNLFRYGAHFALTMISVGLMRDFRNAIFDKILHLPLSFFSKQQKGDLMVRVTDDIKEIDAGITKVLEVFIKEPLLFVLSLIGLFVISAKLTLFVFVLIIVGGGLVGAISRTLKKESSAAQILLSSLLSNFEETLNGLRIIKSFTGEKMQRDRFKSLNNKYSRLFRSMHWKRATASPITEVLAVGILCVVLMYGGGLVFAGSIQPEQFITFMVIYSQLIPPAKSFTGSLFKLKIGLASAERVFAVLDTTDDLPEHPNAVSKKTLESDIHFNHVTFKYESSDVTTLKGIDLKLQKGKTLALVGESGAGKTTLADLLPRFYEVTDGAILLDGIDVKTIKIADLRDMFGVVSQEAVLFNDTVYNNIAFGANNVTEEMVIDAAKKANAHGFISKLEHGYHTNVGERGGLLSGGERQRITIARAILKNPQILILDEATSALDSENESLVQSALTTLMEGRTSIVIAHRLSTIQHADEIVVMREGEIVERGDHQSLLELNGIYQKFVSLQAF